MNSDQERFVAFVICAGAMVGALRFIGFQAAVVLGLILTIGLLFEIWATARAVEREAWAAGETLRESDADN